MSEQLQLRSGTAAQVAAFTGASAECVVDTTNNRLVVNDGSTTGGWSAGIERRTPVADAAYTVLITDRIVAYTSITAARVVTLPAASTYPTGARLMIVDESGAVTTTNTIAITAAGSDKIDGQAALYLNMSYGYFEIESNGSNAWTIIASSKFAGLCPHGANTQFYVTEILLSGLSGASVTATAAVPANCLLFSVGAYVTTTITGCTSFEIGDAGQTGDSGNSLTRFGSSLGLTAGTSNYGLIGPTAIYSAVNVILTAVGGGASFSAGAVRLSIHYALVSPSNS